MANNKYMNITINGKTYKYYFFQVYTPNNEPPYSSPTKNPENVTRNIKFKHYESDIIPLFNFLELPRQETNLAAEIDGKPVTVSIKKYSSSYEYYYAEFKSGNYSFEIYEPLTDVDATIATTQGTSIGFNYATNKFVSMQGGTSFVATQKSPLQLRLYFDNSFYGHYPLPAYKYTSDLPIDTHFEAKYPAGWVTATFRIFTNFDSFQKNNDWKQTGYPDSDDDPEKDDDDPTDPSPSPGDDSSDDIPIPPKPVVDVTGTGFVTLYNPSAVDIRQLAYFMWSGEFTDLLKKMFSAPFDCLIGLKLLYAPLTTGASQTIWLGNVESTVSAPKITDQFTDFDCGSIQLAGYFNSFLDYSPYTKVTIFLPFIGYKELNVDEVMNATLHLTYRIDAYSGSCVAFLHVSKSIGNTQVNSVLYEFDGNAAMDIPFTSGDMSRYVAAVLGTAASTAGAVVSMGAGARLATSTVTPTSSDPWTKNSMEKQTVTGLSDLGNGSAELIGGKPHIQRGGSLAGANASMALKQPYVIIERPIQQMPSDYPSFIGIPLNMWFSTDKFC